MNDVEVRRITADEALVVRWPVLRPGFPREDAVFPGDDAPETIHLGGFKAGELVGVASVYRVPMPGKPEVSHAWQLRGMATLPNCQRFGVGSAVLAGSVRAVKEAGGALLWCNARVVAVPFYQRHGWEIIGPEFDIPTVGPHYRMWYACAR